MQALLGAYTSHTAVTAFVWSVIRHIVPQVNGLICTLALPPHVCKQLPRRLAVACRHLHLLVPHCEIIGRMQL